MTRIPLYQRHLTDRSIAGKTVVHNIEPVGDPLTPKQDNILRIAFQNIHGATDIQKEAIPSEGEAMEELEIDIMGMAETNRPWNNHQNNQEKALYDAYMNKRFKGSRTVYTAAPTKDHTLRYQPGGNLLTANGEITARIDGHGTDKWGRFCWFQFKGRRDEGVIVIVGYRVCQEKSSNPGPFTAFRQQYIAMRDKGDTDPNPRAKILSDLESLINEKRTLGYRPILLIDANGDYIHGKDDGLSSFLTNAKLCDPFLERYKDPIRTYLHGSRRIDYIFMDSALTSFITNIGYLGTHDGAVSDHALAYVDMDHTQMFAGLINRPPPPHLREILIEQEDKVQGFLRLIHLQFEAQKFAERVFTLAGAFSTEGASQTNITNYNNMYAQFLEIVHGVTRKVGKRPVGYMRSRTLSTAGNRVLLSKYLLDCKTRGVPPTKKLLKLGERLSIDVHALLELSDRDLRIRMRRDRHHLWDCQKNCASLREEYLELEARQNAIAAGDKDWEARVRKMKRKIKVTSMNRKLTAVLKGPRGALKMIQVPTHDWFYSESSDELYHYHRGVFEAFPAAELNLFHSHHTRKVLPSDAQAVLVERDETDKYWTVRNVIPLPSPLWRDITNTEEIETNLLQRNQMHLEQTAREKGISTRPPLTTLRDNNGFNDLSRRVLDGQEITEYQLTEEMAAYFQALKQSDKEKALPPVLGIITSSDLQEMFKVAKERTSSDSRTPNYTIWKCLARSDKIAGFLSVLLSLPFVYGFVNSRWTNMTDFMLEKKTGARQIHLLRIIGKVPAEFNTCLKFLIGKLTSANFEASDTSDEQHGFRPNCSAPDAMMLKLLTFECARMSKYTMGILQHDMTAHFDRMYHEMTAITGTKYGVSESVMQSIGKTIMGLRRNVETSLGVSTGSYGQEAGAPRLGGMVQGKADVPQFATQQSDAMLKAHSSMTYGVHITSPALHREIKHHSVAFADDTEGQVSSETTDNLSIPRVIGRLQHSGQTWSNLTNICGGLIAHHKCCWQLLAWEMRSGHLRPRREVDGQLLLHDGKGSQVAIKYLSPDEPNVGLGFNLCISGNQMPQFNSALTKITTLCKSAAVAYLTEHEARSLITQRLRPKLSYLLHGTSFTRKQCHTIDKVIRPTLVPLIRLNRHYPSAILHGPLAYGGMEFIDTYTLQDQVQIDYLVKQLRWDKIVANAFLVALDSTQLCSGFITPILENTYGDITYLMPSYIISLRQRLSEIDASLWIEKSWTPALQREHDFSIMEGFLRITGITRATLEKANAVRLYLRVLTIADISDVNGTFIPAGQLDGNWQSGSDLKWPHQPKPPKTFWTTFRTCIRLAFCSKTPTHQRAGHSMFLDRPLGRWLPVPRNTWFDAYRSNDAIYWRQHDDENLSIMKETTTPGIYTQVGITTTPPLDSYPVQRLQPDDDMWPDMNHENLRRQITTSTRCAGNIHTNTLDIHSDNPLYFGSDGSTHLQHGIATCAWVLHQDEEHVLKASYLIGNISSLSSYRSELEGMYRGLKQIESSSIKPQLIKQWCDNEAAVNKYNQRWIGPGDMLAPDMDVILAIHHTKRIIEEKSAIICRHIYGHQDTKHREQHTDDQETVTESLDQDSSTVSTNEIDEELTPTPVAATKTDKPRSNLPVQLNVECDRLATTAAQNRETDTSETPTDQYFITPPYAGSKALLRIRGRWITSHQKQHVHHARWEPAVRIYCYDKYHWTSEVFDSVSWTTIKSVRKRLTATQRMQTSKIMHCWLPTKHMESHKTGTSQCPGCRCTDETMDHMFKCSNKTIATKRDKLLVDLRTKGLKIGIPRPIMEAISMLLYDYVNGNQAHTPQQPDIARATKAQLDIGISLLPRGFLAEEWIVVLETFSVEKPERKLARLLKAIWVDFTDKLWQNRNEIAHKKDNQSSLTETQTWASKLEWFLDNPHVIARSDKFLLNFERTDIQAMTPQVRKKIATQLEAVQKAFTRQKQLRKEGQRPITDFFTTNST